jgi:hypothetical protein
MVSKTGLNAILRAGFGRDYNYSGPFESGLVVNVDDLISAPDTPLRLCWSIQLWRDEVGLIKLDAEFFGRVAVVEEYIGVNGNTIHVDDEIIFIYHEARFPQARTG